MSKKRKGLISDRPELEVDEDNWIETEVRISLSDIIDNDFEGFLDIISEAATGSELLMDIDYRAVGVEDDGSIRIWVTGDASGIIETE